MADDFDRELDQAPEGSILAPIFIGCGAMGLGCLFSVGVIVIGLLIFAPGIWSTITAMGDNPMLETALPLVEANPVVVEALGTPIVADLDDIDEAPGADLGAINIGDEIELLAVYDLEGPKGTARLEAVGTRALVADDVWIIRSLIVILDGGVEVRVYPIETPETPDAGEAASPETPDPVAPELESAEPVATETMDGASDEPAPDETGN